MSDDSEQNQTAESSVASGPGSRLREARELRKLTPEQVASQLRMQTRIIEALENDDYSSLHGSTFIQGYLRSYSRLLGLPEENILALMPAEGVEDSLLVSSILQGKSEVTSRDLPFRMVSFLILLVVVIGLGWWVSQRTPTAESTSVDVEQPGGEQGLLVPNEIAQPDDDVQPVNVDIDTENGTAGESQTENSQTEMEVTEELNGSDSESVESQQLEPTVVEPPTISSPTVTPVDPPALTVEMPQSLIELEYQADSWTEVTDAAGRKLAYSLMPAGRSIKLRGEAPFKIFLGFATGVTVYYNGVLYDHSPFQRDDMARFRIGRAEHNHPGVR
ncbi:MAG: RodZ domain-containing protein [Pseudomonadota bacterium]